MILNDDWILRAEPFRPFDPAQINPASLDLSWSGVYRKPLPLPIHEDEGPVEVIKTWDREWCKKLRYWSDPCEAETLTLWPGGIYLLDTLQVVEIQLGTAALLTLKSSTGRWGLMQFHTGLFDPGYGLERPSTGTFGVFNPSPWTMEIRRGQNLVQLISVKMDKPPVQDYREVGRYHGQVGPAPAR